MGRAQQHLAAWDPGSFLLLIQKDLPVSGGEQGGDSFPEWPELSSPLHFHPQPLLSAVEALSSLASEAALSLEVEQQLGLEIHKLTAKMQVSAEP